MASDRWTPTDEVSKTDKYEWKSPSNNTQHEEQTTGPGDLMIKPKDMTLVPTSSPKRSGLQWGQDAWNFDNAPDSNWYIFGSISDLPDPPGIIPPPVPDVDTKALQLDTGGFGEHLRNNTDQSMGIGNTFSIQQNLEPSTDSLDRNTFNIYESSGTANFISMSFMGSVANKPIRIIFKDSGGIFKQHDWNNQWSLDVKVSVLFTWDGTDLKLYVDGVDQGAPDAMVIDDAGTFADTSRRIVIFAVNVAGSGADPFLGKGHSASIWDVVLTQAEITALQNGGTPQDFDNQLDTGNYTSSANLQHYWRHGFNASDIGEDLGNATILIDVGDDASNITSDDIVEY